MVSFFAAQIFADILQIWYSFMAVLKEEVIYIDFFYYTYKSNQVWKLQCMVEPEISSLVLILCIGYNPYPGYILMMMM